MTVVDRALSRFSRRWCTKKNPLFFFGFFDRASGDASTLLIFLREAVGGTHKQRLRIGLIANMRLPHKRPLVA